MARDYLVTRIYQAKLADSAIEPLNTFLSTLPDASYYGDPSSWRVEMMA
ncbi:MAG: hypothetical protein V3V05_06880 [Pontiella sp.]